MTKAEALKLMAWMTAHYPGKDLPQETINLWVGYLTLVDREIAAQAARECVDEHKWFPSWSEFKEKLVRGGNPSPEQAWAIAIGKGGVGCPQLVAKAVRAIGGDYQFRTASGAGLEHLRKTFIAAYETQMSQFKKDREQQIKLVQAGNPIKQITGGK